MEHTATHGRSNLLVLILTLGVFGILNTEMGGIGMLPLIAETFQVTVPQAGWRVTIFARVVALSGPVMPMLFSKLDRKLVMLLALGIFIISNAVARVFIGVSAGMVLGVPAASFIASAASYSMAMLFFMLVNVLGFAATLFCVPSMR